MAAMLCSPQAASDSLASHEKKRRACDECRNRKLACTKESDGCRRCRRESLACVYSAQKPMGRPRKRPRNGAGPARSPAPGITSLPPSLPPAAAAESEDASSGLSFLADQAPYMIFSGYDGLLDPQLQTPALPLPLPLTLPTPASLSAGMMSGMTPFFDGSDLLPVAASTGAVAADCGTATEMDTLALDPVTADDAAVVCQDLQRQALTPPATVPHSLSTSPTVRSVHLTAAAQEITAAAAGTQIHPMLSGGNGESSSDGDDPADGCAQAASAWLLTVPRRSCGCLARLYLALDALQHLPDEVSPALAVARSAARTAHDTVLCPHCAPSLPGEAKAPGVAAAPATAKTPAPPAPPPLAFNALHEHPPPESFPNMMLLCALLPTLAHAYRRILARVDAEAARAAAARQQLPLTLQAYGGVWGPLAAPWAAMAAARARADAPPPAACTTPADVMALLTGSCMVEPALWRLVVRTLLKTDVYGIHADAPGGYVPPCPVATAATPADAATDHPHPHPHPAPAAGCTAGGCTVDGTPPVTLHYGLRDIVDMMEKRAQPRCRPAGGSSSSSTGPAPATVPGTPYEIDFRQQWTEFAQRPQNFKHPCERVIELARYEIERLVIV